MKLIEAKNGQKWIQDFWKLSLYLLGYNRDYGVSTKQFVISYFRSGTTTGFRYSRSIGPTKYSSTSIGRILRRSQPAQSHASRKHGRWQPRERRCPRRPSRTQTRHRVRRVAEPRGPPCPRRTAALVEADRAGPDSGGRPRRRLGAARAANGAQALGPRPGRRGSARGSAPVERLPASSSRRPTERGALGPPRCDDAPAGRDDAPMQPAARVGRGRVLRSRRALDTDPNVARMALLSRVQVRPHALVAGVVEIVRSNAGGPRPDGRHKGPAPQADPAQRPRRRRGRDRLRAATANRCFAARTSTRPASSTPTPGCPAGANPDPTRRPERRLGSETRPPARASARARRGAGRPRAPRRDGRPDVGLVVAPGPRPRRRARRRIGAAGARSGARQPGLSRNFAPPVPLASLATRPLRRRLFPQNLPCTLCAQLAPEPNDWTLDLCAGPGGKTSHLAMLMRDRGRARAGRLAAPRRRRRDALRTHGAHVRRVGAHGRPHADARDGGAGDARASGRDRAPARRRGKPWEASGQAETGQAETGQAETGQKRGSQAPRALRPRALRPRALRPRARGPAVQRPRRPTALPPGRVAGCAPSCRTSGEKSEPPHGASSGRAGRWCTRPARSTSTRTRRRCGGSSTRFRAPAGAAAPVPSRDAEPTGPRGLRPLEAERRLVQRFDPHGPGDSVGFFMAKFVAIQ